MSDRRTATQLIRGRPDQIARIGTVAPDGGAMVRSMPLDGLMRKWRARAHELRPYTASTAAAFERAAAELEETLTIYLMEPLTLAKAGRRRAPRILRRDLPRKATSLRTTEPPPTLVGATPRQIARAVLDS